MRELGRRRLRRAGVALSLGSALYWLSTLILIDVTYFGDRMTVSAGDGCLAFYWNPDAEYRNSRVLNAFEWPHFPASGAGTDWSLERWGRWYVNGPRDLMGRLPHRLAYPRNFGFYIPSCKLWGWSDRTSLWYVGMPSWTIVAIGLTCLAAARLTKRSFVATCSRCGYDRAGLPTVAACPECGLAPSSKQSRGLTGH